MGDGEFQIPGDSREKHVRFSSLGNDGGPHHKRRNLSAKEKYSLWWTLEELRSMTANASIWAEESRRSKALIESLDDALREARRASLVKNPEFPEDAGLRLWCQYGHARRGLERTASALHEQTRSNIINMIRRRVVMLSQSGASAEEIRKASEKGSRSSVIFARIIGMADARAAMTPFPLSNRPRSALTDATL